MRMDICLRNMLKIAGVGKEVLANLKVGNCLQQEEDCYLFLSPIYSNRPPWIHNLV
jgi:hypothetical protein